MAELVPMDRRRFIGLAGLTALAVAGCSSSSSTSGSSGAPSSGASGSTGTPSLSSSPSSAAPLTGTLSFVYGAFAAQSKWESYFKDFLTANPGIKIKYIPVSLDNGWGPYTQKIAALTASGQTIDVLWVATEGVASLAQKGVLQNLDDFISRDAADPELKDYLADVSPQLLQAVQSDGHQYLLPFAWNDIVTWYNPKVLAAAGASAPSPTWNRDDYLALAKQLTRDTNSDGKTDVWGAVVDPGWFNVSAWVYAAGGSLLSDDRKTAQFDTAPVQEVLQFLHDLIFKYKVAPQLPVKSDDLFQAGKLGMFQAGRWPLQTYEPNKFTDFQITTLPQGSQAATVIGSDGYGVGAKSKNQEAAWALVKALGTTSVMTNLVKVTGASGSIPARKSLALSADMAPPSNYKLFYDQASVGKPVPTGPLYPDISAVFDRYMSKLMANETTVEAATKAMQSESTAILQRG